MFLGHTFRRTLCTTRSLWGAIKNGNSLTVETKRAQPLSKSSCLHGLANLNTQHRERGEFEHLVRESLTHIDHPLTTGTLVAAEVAEYGLNNLKETADQQVPALTNTIKDHMPVLNNKMKEGFSSFQKLIPKSVR